MRPQFHRYARPARLRRAAFALTLAGIVTLAACSKKEAAAPEPRPVVAVAVHADGSATAAASLPGDVQAR
jgi:multidrug efflux system membrane fusion protein